MPTGNAVTEGTSLPPVITVAGDEIDGAADNDVAVSQLTELSEEVGAGTSSDEV